ncbi:MAG: hypothetical protein WD397_16940 [Wenzhouxiangellaceae bacterium]
MTNRITVLVICIAAFLVLHSANVRADSSAPQIAYLGLSEGIWQCWVINADGTGARQVTRSAQDTLRVSWYPGGSKLLANKADGNIYEVSLENGDEKHIPLELEGFQDAVVSPDGQRIAFSLSTSGSRDDNNIWLATLSDGALLKVTNMPWLQHEPVWTPDGMALYFLSGDGGQTHDIWRVVLPDGTPEQLTANQAYHFDVDVAVDGRLAYSNNQDGLYDLWLREDGREDSKLTDHRALDANPSWSPDGKKLVFSSTREGGPDLWLLDTGNGDLKRLTNTNGGARSPVWRKAEER